MNEHGEQYFDSRQIHTSVLKVQCALKLIHTQNNSCVKYCEKSDGRS